MTHKPLIQEIQLEALTKLSLSIIKAVEVGRRRESIVKFIRYKNWGLEPVAKMANSQWPIRQFLFYSN